MAKPILYWASGSPYAWRAMLALAIKKVEHEARLLSFSAGDTRSPEFLAVNPRGKVPAFVDGDVVLWESAAILVYVDGKWPAPPLFGNDPVTRARIQRAISEVENYLVPAQRGVSGPVFEDRVAAARESVEEQLVILHDELARLDGELAQRQWLAGDAITAADLVLYPIWQVILRTADKPAAEAIDLRRPALAQRYPHLMAWQARIDALPGVAETYPPHWRASP